jgi:ketosteroid isomerase-like protein
MPRFSRLFEAAEDTLDAFRDAMKRRDTEGVLRLWLDDESVSCTLPDGQRVVGMERLRTLFTTLLENQPVWIEAVGVESMSTLGVSVFQATEAMRFNLDAVEADLYVHTTYVLMQNHEGWRFSHIHCSPACETQMVSADGIGTPVRHSMH